MNIPLVARDIRQNLKRTLTAFCQEQQCAKESPDFDLSTWLPTFAHRPYIEVLKHAALPEQQRLWQRRAIFLHHCLGLAADLMRDRQAHAAWYRRHALTRAFVTMDPAEYTFSNFGSNKTTSDIDIGIDFTGQKGNMAFVIATIEDVMFVVGGQSTLNFDIEFYGNFLTVHDQYFLKCTQLRLKDVKRLLPAIEAGIIRNYWYAVGPSDLRTFDWDIPELQVIATLDKTGQVRRLLSDMALHRKALLLARRYLQHPWARSRELYYRRLKRTDRLVDRVRRGVLTHDLMVDIMTAYSEAAVFRQENYVNPATVMHVVRMMQGQQDQPCTRDAPFTQVPACTLGRWGYLFSMMEQAGYVYRFRMFDIHAETKCLMQEIRQTACSSAQTKSEQEHYVQKRDKYMKRYIHARQRYMALR